MAPMLGSSVAERRYSMVVAAAATIPLPKHASRNKPKATQAAFEGSIVLVCNWYTATF